MSQPSASRRATVIRGGLIVVLLGLISFYLATRVEWNAAAKQAEILRQMEKTQTDLCLHHRAQAGLRLIEWRLTHPAPEPLPEHAILCEQGVLVCSCPAGGKWTVVEKNGFASVLCDKHPAQKGS
jgi:hypothetical protein